MSYQIRITKTAECDIINAADCIDNVLKNPEAAEDLLDEADRQVNSLSEFPERFRLVDDAVLSSWGIRFIAVKNYLPFYVTDSDSSVVTVVRFLYQKSNWNVILHAGVPMV